MRIFKYKLEIIDEQSIEFPVGGQILKVDQQNGGLFIWALVPEHSHTYQMPIKIVGTGHKFDDSVGYFHLGTVVMNDGWLVWHVFRKHI